MHDLKSRGFFFHDKKLQAHDLKFQVLFMIKNYNVAQSYLRKQYNNVSCTLVFQNPLNVWDICLAEIKALFPSFCTNVYLKVIDLKKFECIR